MIRLLDGGVLLCLASCVMVTKSESTQNARILHTNSDTRQQLQDTDAPIQLSATSANNMFDLMENAKRAWKDLQGSGWGKRSWQDLQSSGWGKRGWQDLQTSGWGKRGWQDFQPGWGKRAWQNLPSSGWGKRARRAYQNSWATKSRNGFDSNDKLMTDEISGMDATDAIAAEDDDSMDVVKKQWDQMKGPWGKRDASDWGSMKGAWGKRDPAWHNLKGLWGKRSSPLTADNLYDFNSQDLQAEYYPAVRCYNGNAFVSPRIALVPPRIAHLVKKKSYGYEARLCSFFTELYDADAVTPRLKSKRVNAASTSPRADL